MDMYTIEKDNDDDDDVFAAHSSSMRMATCNKNNPIIVTQLLGSLSTSCISWDHHGNKNKSFTTSMEKELKHVGNVEKEKSVSDELVEKLNGCKLNE